MVHFQDIPYNYNYRTRQVVRSWGSADTRIEHTEDGVRRVERKDFATLYDEFNKNNLLTAIDMIEEQSKEEREIYASRNNRRMIMT